MESNNEAETSVFSPQFDPSIMDRISDAFLALDSNWVFTFVNEKAAQIFGRSSESLLGKNIWEELPNSKGQVFHTMFLKAMETQEYQQCREFFEPLGVWLEKRMYPSKEGLTVFFNDISDQVATELIVQDKLKKYELFKSFLDHSYDSIQVANMDGYLVFANDVALDRLGISEENLNSVNVIDFEDAFNSQEDWQNHVDQMRREKKLVLESTNTNLTTGSKVHIEVTLTHEYINEIEYIIAISRDVSQRKAAELKLKSSIEEKESLLAEIHRRVKNNLAVVAGLMYLQTKDTNNEELNERLHLNIDRIKSIAAIHEELYKSQNFSQINFAKNIRRIVENLQKESFKNSEVIVHLHLEDLYLDIANALPASLILNELVTNSYKHAFDGIENPEITIDLTQAGGVIQLKIADNGNGLPKDFKPNTSASMGFHLVTSLITQLDATMHHTNKNGLVYTILL